MREFDELERKTRHARSGPPLVTSFIGLAVVLIFVASSLEAVTLNAVGTCAGPVLSMGQVWRLFIAMFFHTGLLPLLINVLGFAYLGFKLESTMGSFYFFTLLCSFGLASNVLGICIDWTLFKISSDVSYLTSCSCGLSAIILALFTVYAALLHNNQDDDSFRWLAYPAILILVLLHFSYKLAVTP